MTRTILISLLATVPLFSQDTLSNSAEIDAYLEQVVEPTKIPGIVAMAVDKNGVIYQGNFGERDSANGRPMQANTIFRIASMTKPVATTAIMMLVEEGKLSLDDPISKYIPDFNERGVIENFNPTGDSYTTRPPSPEPLIRHMLSHSSGLAYTAMNNVANQVSRSDSPPDPMPLIFDPGTRWAYANGIATVGHVLERIEGKGLDSFFEERIFGPLDMRDTSFIVPAAKHERVATVHSTSDEGLVENPNPVDIRSSVSGDGGLHSTAGDYVKFIQMFLRGGTAPDGTRLVSEESLHIMGMNQLGDVKVSLQDEPQPNFVRAFPLGAGRDGFGLGFQVTGLYDSAKIRAPGSLSWAGIFNTVFWIDPATGVGAVLLMQYLPFYDDAAIETLQGFEQRVYAELR
jgi:methyl acetate hydrolase